MFGSSGNYNQFPGSYPSEQESNSVLLTPALVGLGGFSLFAQLFRVDESSLKKSSVVGKAGLIIYSAIATAGISYYIYIALTTTSHKPLDAFLPVSWALWVTILYYAAVYNLLYRLHPASLAGEFGETRFDQFVSFFYFSITTFSNAGPEDMAPRSNTARILVSIQVIFFVFIFTMGFIFFIGA